MSSVRILGFSELPHEGNQILFFLRIQLQLQHKIKKLHRIFECQAAAIVHIWRAILDSTKREGLDWAIPWLVRQETIQV